MSLAFMHRKQAWMRRLRDTFGGGVDEIVHNIPPAERLFIRGDFNGHIGSTAGGYGEVHGNFGFGDRNAGCTLLLDFAKAFELVIANSSFKDCKVIPGETRATQNRLLVMDIYIIMKRKKRTA
ncbi:uncharacterized protein LOC142177167 [Nicotiana tabacum]|uniref:Uncharacterized protein LOC142177167 n=1 Tax=Nicotiana tabacum TaxID=4097 RepID=A0AC58TX17_TOBAC